MVTIRTVLSLAAVNDWWNDPSLIQDMKNVLQSNFKIKDLGELRYFLGLEFARTKDGVLMHQRKYALELISDLVLAGSKPLGAPLKLNLKLTFAEFDQHAATKVVRYVKQAPGLGIFFSASGSNQLQAFCDADWASCPVSMKSTTGYVIKYGNSLI
ncbi:uncharacterized mitochondrial protein AtMg00810-like [Nicotiana tomentosiformis]|uniref:uncharacterized mitochondrial protein AtMg00810-like n=1 Tax=Nicotiana tomentosiformis TaxID=4098 RepID=UPI00388C8958